MIATLATRTLQLLFAVVVLGLSITAAKWQMVGSVPATTAFSAFAGAFAILVALIGFAAIWITAISSLVMSAIDCLASMLLLAGGIAFAVKLRGIDCESSEDNYHNSVDNPLVNSGCVHNENRHKYYCGFDYNDMPGRCRTVEADAAFLFLGFLACIATAVLCFLAHKRGGTGRSSVV